MSGKQGVTAVEKETGLKPGYLILQQAATAITGDPLFARLHKAERQRRIVEFMDQVTCRIDEIVPEDQNVLTVDVVCAAAAAIFHTWPDRLRVFVEAHDSDGVARFLAAHDDWTTAPCGCGAGHMNVIEKEQLAKEQAASDEASDFSDEVFQRLFGIDLGLGGRGH